VTDIPAEKRCACQHTSPFTCAEKRTLDRIPCSCACHKKQVSISLCLGAKLTKALKEAKEGNKKARNLLRYQLRYIRNSHSSAPSKPLYAHRNAIRREAPEGLVAPREAAYFRACLKAWRDFALDTASVVTTVR